MYSKKQIDKAGELLKKNHSNEALKILSYWRAKHSYVLNIFHNRLKKFSKKIDKYSFTSQRLKRTSSIIKKLNRYTTRLTQIQDMAGCRAVLSNVKLAKIVYEKYYLRGDLKHELINKQDYITYPKPDGYRSIHLIYKYKSDKQNKNNGLLVEIQIRSKLQHLWATAVETTSFFIGNSLKLNEGEKKWKEFFKLVSSAFAIIEESPLVPNTPINKEKLYCEIKKQEKELKFLEKLNEWTNSIREIEQLTKTNKELFLLKLDTNLKELNIKAYSKRQEKAAIKNYIDYEKDIYEKKGYDIVLVSTDKITNLKKAYPNYFLDTKEFIKQLKKILF